MGLFKIAPFTKDITIGLDIQYLQHFGLRLHVRMSINEMLHFIIDVDNSNAFIKTILYNRSGNARENLIPILLISHHFCPTCKMYAHILAPPASFSKTLSKPNAFILCLLQNLAMLPFQLFCC